MAKETKSIIEALLIVSESGLSPEDIRTAAPDLDLKDIREGVSVLRKEYESSGRAFNIAEVAGKYRIVTRPDFLPWINNLYKKETDRMTGPSMETLAILAYKQPATRAEVENVRGVSVGGVLKTLQEKDLIKIKGRKDVPGRPLLYSTTEKFLELFGLNSLDDLPALTDFKEEDLDYGKQDETSLVKEIEEKVEVYEVDENTEQPEKTDAEASGDAAPGEDTTGTADISRCDAEDAASLVREEDETK